MNNVASTIATTLLGTLLTVSVVQAKESVKPMQGVPPSAESQVTMHNYRDHPNNRWAFRNVGAPLNVRMVPRQGTVSALSDPAQPNLGKQPFTDLHGRDLSLDELFEANYADGLVVVKGNELVYEKYFHDFNPRAQHIWFSMTKSLASSVFGLLVEEGKVDLSASPVKYIPELKGSGFERTTIQQVLDHATGIDFKENYTDPNSDFFRYYAPAANMGWLPGAADVQPGDTDIYGLHDFLVHFVKADQKVTPGEVFDYNSSNADLLGWLIARISGESFQDYLQRNLWAKLGAEHDAYLVVDRAYMPVATGGMNSTTRDAARFGMMIRDRGRFGNTQVLPGSWVDASLNLTKRHISTMRANPKYQDDPWQAYHNMWWILDAEAGEYCAVGIHGQVIYINRSTDTVMAWFSSQPTASASRNKDFHSKLNAARSLAKSL